MVANGFVNTDNSPTPEAAQCLPSDLECPTGEELTNRIFVFHDESIFSANEAQKTTWGSSDMNVILPKSKGSSTMVSDFI